MGIFGRKSKNEQENASNNELAGFAHLKKENFKISAEELGIYPDGCIVSKRIYTDGAVIGWFEKTNPSPNHPDSGWCFYAGDGTEDEAFSSNPNNAKMFKLETIANYDLSIVPILKMNVPVGIGFARDESAPNGWRAEEITDED